MWSREGKRFALKAVVFGTIAFFLSGALITAVGERWRLAIDTQRRQCLPWTTYIVSVGRPAEIRRGDVMAYFPGGRMGHGFDEWIDARNDAYGRFAVKIVGAVPGDELVIKQDVAYVNGREIGKMDLVAKLGKKPGGFDREERVPDGQYLMIGTEPRSYDGRYWGFIERKDVIGRARPIW